MKNWDRRQILRLAGASALSGRLLLPQVAFADAPTEKRFILLLLRGGLDGLHTVVPYGDREYERLRPNLTVENPLKLDGYFGLHPKLADFHKLYQAGEMLFVPAASTNYRSRSHFDGQNLLENGSGIPHGADDGWLNRALAGFGNSTHRLGLAVGRQLPLILQGQTQIQSWSETQLPELSEEFIVQLSAIYETDPLFARALADAQASEAPDLDMMKMGRGYKGPDLSRSAKAAADLLSRADGPRIAVMESQGWDTHFDQDRRLGNLFEDISGAVTALKSGLGPVWADTVVMVVSEFGRTAAQNGNRGTDHGTGGLAMLVGGAVKGGRVVGEWPGLKKSDLYEGRDLRAVNSYEAIFKSLLINHLGLSERHVATQVFPGNLNRPMDGLLA